MNKSKAIALPLLLVIMLGAMGLGFAYWTETLVIDDNVNTGELKVRMGDFGSGIYWYTYGDELLETDYSISEDGLTLTMTLGNMYPRAAASFRFPIKNIGTIPAVIESVTLTVSDSGGLKDYIKVKGHFWHCGVDGHTVPGGHDTFGPYLLDSVDYWMYILMDGRVLLPGQTFSWEEDPEKPGEGSLCFYLLDSAPDSTEGQTITFTLTMTFKQWNY